MTTPDHQELAAALGEWLPSRRWFQGKARDLQAIAVVDEASLPGDGSGQVLAIVVELTYGDGGAERYFVPLVADERGSIRCSGRQWDDALAHPAAVRTLARLTTEAMAIATSSGGQLLGRPVTGLGPDPDAAVRALGVEQTNSSVVLGDAYILKLLRRLEPGPHPDVEITAALTSVDYAHVPAQHGAVVAQAPDGTETALAVLSDFLGDAREGWDLATAETERIAAGEPVDEQGLLASLDPLGEAVAELHTTLADTLGWRPAGRDATAAWSRAMIEQLERVTAVAASRAPEATAEVRAREAELRRSFEGLARLADAGRVTRVHGDLHLGQVLRDEDGTWQLLDFEGEPARPLEERRAPSSPLRDVAGMLRSFDYATAAPDPTAPPTPALVQWRDTARRRFLSGYVRHAGPLIPGARAAETLLTAFELDKAVYELGYELANRPDWVPIPAGGILRALDAHHAHPQ